MNRTLHRHPRVGPFTAAGAWSLLVLCVLTIGACETVVDIDYPDQDPAITVNSIFMPDYNFEIHLSEARQVVKNDRSIPPITDAEAELFRNGDFVERLPHVGDGLYRSPFTRPAPGDVFELRVSAPGYESIVARDRVPEAVPIEFLFDDRQSNVAPELELTIDLHDPSARKNYYRLTAVYQYDGPNGLSIRQAGFYTDDDAIVAETVDPFEDGNNDLNYIETAFFSDELLDEGTHEIRIELRAPQGISGWFASVEVSLDVISEAFFDYATSYRKFDAFRDNPFKEPVLVANNVENGYGLFAGFCREQFVTEF